jgi:hypothetical protein
VQDCVYDAFTKRLAETAGAMKVADGFEPGAVIGPLSEGREPHRRRAEEVPRSPCAPTNLIKELRDKCRSEIGSRSRLLG